MIRITQKANEQRARLSREFLQILAKSRSGTATAEDTERISALLMEYRELLKNANNTEKG